MGATRKATIHYYDVCKNCDYRKGRKCTISSTENNELCVWRRKRRDMDFAYPKNCPLAKQINQMPSIAPLAEAFNL